MSVLSPHPPRLLLPPSIGLPSYNSLLFLRPPPFPPPFLCRSFSSYSRTSDSVAHRCLASSRGPPPPNEGNRRPETRGTGIPTSVSKIRDSVQIFLAVLFWMSLFFWSSAWDGGDRLSKGPRWRK